MPAFTIHPRVLSDGVFVAVVHKDGASIDIKAQGQNSIDASCRAWDILKERAVQHAFDPSVLPVIHLTIPTPTWGKKYD